MSIFYDALVDTHGGCEILRDLIGTEIKLKAGELGSITDRTPHKALVQPTTDVRRFVVVVISNVSHWFRRALSPIYISQLKFQLMFPNQRVPNNIIIVTTFLRSRHPNCLSFHLSS